MSEDQLPDFIIIGAMKSATSSLYHWLRAQPECWLATPKETNYFALERKWINGQDWYSSFFTDAEEGQLAGEASVSYTFPACAELSAKRMAVTVPDARLIFALREPIERLRSHYRHEALRHRENRPLLKVKALAEPGNAYVATSRYFAFLRPYIDQFPREQILVVRMEDLVTPPYPGWFDVLRFLGLPRRPSPGTAHNVTADKDAKTAALVRLKTRRSISYKAVRRLPKPVRRIGKKALTRGSQISERKLDESRFALPPRMIDEVWDDAEQLAKWLGRRGALWPRPAA